MAVIMKDKQTGEGEGETEIVIGEEKQMECIVGIKRKVVYMIWL